VVIEENHSHSVSVVSMLLVMLALLETVGRPVLMSGSATVSTVLMASELVATPASATASDCRTVDASIDGV